MTKLFTLLLVLNVTIAESQDFVYRARWKFKTQGTIRSAPVLRDDRILFTNGAGVVYCVNKSTGNLQWKFETDGAINGSPAVAAGRVFVMNRSEHIYALDERSGRLLWEKKLPPTIVENIGGWKYFTAAPVVVGDVLFVGSGNGNLYAMDVAQGRERWHYFAGKRIRTAPLIVDNVIYQPANDGRLHVLNKNTGELLWKFETDGANPDPGNPFKDVIRGNVDRPSLKDHTLVFGSRDGKLYGIDIKLQKEKWRHTYGSTWAMANTIDGDRVYVGWSTNNLVSAHDLETGKELWNHPNGGHVYTKPLVIGNSLFYGCSNGQLYEVDKSTGADLGSYQAGAEIFSSPVYDGTSVYFGADDGYLYAVDKIAEPRMVVYMPDTVVGFARGVIADFQLVPFFKEKGFREIHEQELLDFVKARIADKNPSVIVFGYPVIPPAVLGEDVESGPFRKYLESGGKVVWTGTVPNFFALHKDGYYLRDVDTGPRILDVTFESPYESGNYFARPTQEGLNMGMPLWTKTSGTPVHPDGEIVPLMVDEYGYVSGWMKTFDPRPGSGFVSIRTWAWNVAARKDDLEMLYNLAVYGLQ